MTASPGQLCWMVTARLLGNLLVGLTISVALLLLLHFLFLWSSF